MEKLANTKIKKFILICVMCASIIYAIAMLIRYFIH